MDLNTEQMNENLVDSNYDPFNVKGGKDDETQTNQSIRTTRVSEPR